MQEYKAMDFKIDVPDYVLELVNVLDHDSKDRVEIMLVGGAVRDALMHHFHDGTGKFVPKDFDLATNLSEWEILERLRGPIGKARKVTVKEKESVDTFGVVFASINGSPTVEIAPYRKDIGSADGRRPASVERGNIYDDAMRRDLTINNLYYDFRAKRVFDFNEEGQGIEDVRNRRIRMVGDPAQRFEEDKLRVLRFFRFHARFKSENMFMDINAKHEYAIGKYSDLRSFGITSERIQAEFLAGLKQAISVRGFLRDLSMYGMFNTIFPGMKVNAEPWQHGLECRNTKVVLALMLRENLDVDGQLNNLKYPNEITDRVQFLIDSLSYNPHDAVDVLRARDRRQHVSHAETQMDLLELATLVDDQGTINKLKFLAVYQPLNVSGHILMEQGFKGKDIGWEQRRLEQEQFSNQFDTYFG